MKIAKRIQKYSSQERVPLSDNEFPIRGFKMKKETREKRGQSLDDINVDLAASMGDKKQVNEPVQRETQ